MWFITPIEDELVTKRHPVPQEQGLCSADLVVMSVQVKVGLCKRVGIAGSLLSSVLATETISVSNSTEWHEGAHPRRSAAVTAMHSSLCLKYHHYSV